MRSNQHEFLWDWDHGFGSFLVKMGWPGMCQACPCAEQNRWQDAAETIPLRRCQIGSALLGAARNTELV